MQPIKCLCKSSITPLVPLVLKPLLHGGGVIEFNATRLGDCVVADLLPLIMVDNITQRSLESENKCKNKMRYK